MRRAWTIRVRGQLQHGGCTRRSRDKINSRVRPKTGRPQSIRIINRLWTREKPSGTAMFFGWPPIDFVGRFVPGPETFRSAVREIGLLILAASSSGPVEYVSRREFIE